MLTFFFRTSRVVSFLLLPLAFANAQPESISPLYQQTSEAHNIMVQYRADYDNLSRFYTIRDSPERRERLKAIMQEYNRQLQQLPFDKLNTGAKVAYVLFSHNLSEELYQLNLEEKSTTASGSGYRLLIAFMYRKKPAAGYLYLMMPPLPGS